MPSKATVLIVVQNLPVPFDRRVWLEALALRGDGYNIIVICPTGQHQDFRQHYELLEGIHIYRYPAPPDLPYLIGYLFEFTYCWIMTFLISIYILFKHGFHILHICNPPDTYFVLGWLYRWHGVKTIFDHHDLAPEMYLAKGGHKHDLLYRGLRWLESLTLHSADRVIATNESHRTIAQSRGHVATKRIFVVRSAPDTRRLSLYPPNESLKRGKPFLVCYLGEMCSQDGVDVLIDLIHRLRYQHHERRIQFVLMGGGPEWKQLHQRVQSLQLEECVLMTGRVSDEVLCRTLSTADICLDPTPPSEWSDHATMNKVGEYMFFGKPMVVFNLRENRYTADQAALYADTAEEFAQHILYLVNHDEERRTMGTYAYNRARSALLWDYSIPSLLEAYHSLDSEVRAERE